MSRWVVLYATSPSGKTLHMCKMCGRISPTPDKACPTPPSVVSWKQTLPCVLLEELEEVMVEAAAKREEEAPQVTLASPNHGVVTYSSMGGFAGPPFSVHVTLVDERIAALVKAYLPKTENDKEEDRGRLGH